MNIKKYISNKIKKILKNTNIKNYNNFKIKNNNKFSDYQIDGLIELSKKENIKINILFKIIKKKLIKKKIFNKIKIINPGFINIFLNKKYISKIINKISKKKNFNIKKKKKKKIIIDYSSPNIAKQMHIGNLRSTIIGDCVSKILKFLGHKIIKINHIGDWGTQFGIIITWIIKFKLYKKIKDINYIEKIYKKSQKEFNKNKKFAKLSRKNVVKLQKKKKKIIKIWKKIVNITIKENQKIYNYLNIDLKIKNNIGESFYQKKMKKIVDDLINKKIAKKNKKSIIIFSKKKFPIIIQKKDKAFLYSTTDIASIKYRFEKFNINKIIYFTDFRQKEYFKQIFYICKKAKYIPKNFPIKHYSFGLILNKNGKPIKSRKDYNLDIKSIIKEIKIKSKKLIKKKCIYSKNKINRIIKKITIGAIKYMDLSKNRKTNYIFDINKIICLKSNTGPYIQYSYTRIISILRKNNTNTTKSIKNNKFFIISKLEYKICQQILNFETIINKTYKKYKPNILCLYLYKISSLFSNFYEKENISYIKNIKIKKSKLKLIAIISKILRIGLSILGIPILYNI